MASESGLHQPGRRGDVVSPELALVDRELAARARASLPEPDTLRRLEDLARRSTSEAVARANEARRDPSIRQRIRAVHRRHPTALAAGVASTIAVAMLLMDVRVELGRPSEAADPAVPVGPANVQPSESPSTQPGNAPSTTRRAATPAGTVRSFAWAPFSGATGYRVEFFRESSRVFAAETSEPAVTVPATWELGGKRQSLTPGDYRWYVWPVVSGRRSSQAIVRAALTVPAR